MLKPKHTLNQLHSSKNALLLNAPGKYCRVADDSTTEFNVIYVIGIRRGTFSFAQSIWFMWVPGVVAARSSI